jgi:hypothetical protein
MSKWEAGTWLLAVICIPAAIALVGAFDALGIHKVAQLPITFVVGIGLNQLVDKFMEKY